MKFLLLLHLLNGIMPWFANAHVIMISPEPYSKDKINNSPLAADGSDFPCKLQPSDFEIPLEETVYRIGENYSIKFQGSVAHGGGSCQVSLTSDRKPTKDSKWKVIHSCEGGCPANVAGNLPGDALSKILPPLNFTIPLGLQPGKYSLAWTWFNRIGNREMYMNCAPVTLVGSASNDDPIYQSDLFSDLPNMFIANINGCQTRENIDIRFPQAGGSVEYRGEASYLAGMNEPACIGDPAFGRSTVRTKGSPIKHPTATSPVQFLTLARPQSSSCRCRSNKKWD
ncbi:uncharacterized protein N7483_002562 [Penicillium malachiteum]|uniref:uncharacterized protein n=1 Tax=Penicillium malachiteum TaxID=1324776 RepID=UPI0025493B22|nr:uncharacterized protein N7483_002562 [Penicillium malachiteum]KAJ5737437.1 hypothetical protein N7483_002562 [Penicillium malachiteum]